jgi:HNH endonuclease
VRCFFCLEEKAPSDEHVFPAAIGGTLKTNRVCTACNSFLGKEVDVRLTDHPAILMKRQESGMTRSGGKPVDATKKLFAKGTLAADPEKRIQMVSEPITGRLTPKMMYHESRTESEDGTEQRQVTLDESDIGALEKIVQRHRKNAGLQPLPEEEIQALIADARRNMRTLEQPEVVYAVKVDAFHFQRAVCKISYELACIWLGDAYLNDPAAEPIRNFILTGKEAEIPGKIQLGGNMPPLSLWQSEPKAHVGLALQQGDKIAIGVQVFDAVSGVVIVTNAARSYPNLKDGRFVLMDLVGSSSRNTTLTDEAFRATRRPRDAARPGYNQS